MRINRFFLAVAIIGTFSSYCSEKQVSAVKPVVASMFSAPDYEFFSKQHLRNIGMCLLVPKVSKVLIPTHLEALKNDILENEAKTREEMFSLMRSLDSATFDAVDKALTEQYKALLTGAGTNTSVDPQLPQTWVKKAHAKLEASGFNPSAITMGGATRSPNWVAQVSVLTDYERTGSGVEPILKEVSLNINMRYVKENIETQSPELQSAIFQHVVEHEGTHVKRNHIIDLAKACLSWDIIMDSHGENHMIDLGAHHPVIQNYVAASEKVADTLPSLEGPNVRQASKNALIAIENDVVGYHEHINDLQIVRSYRILEEFHENREKHINNVKIIAGNIGNTSRNACNNCVIS